MLHQITKKFVISNRIYEKYCSAFDHMKLKAGAFCPDLEVIHREILPNLEDNIVFLMWVEETGIETEDNKKSRAMVREVLKNCLTITD